MLDPYDPTLTLLSDKSFKRKQSCSGLSRLTRARRITAEGGPKQPESVEIYPSRVRTLEPTELYRETLDEERPSLVDGAVADLGRRHRQLESVVAEIAFMCDNDRNQFCVESLPTLGGDVNRTAAVADGPILGGWAVDRDYDGNLYVDRYASVTCYHIEGEQVALSLQLCSEAVTQRLA